MGKVVPTCVVIFGKASGDFIVDLPMMWVAPGLSAASLHRLVKSRYSFGSVYQSHPWVQVESLIHEPIIVAYSPYNKIRNVCSPIPDVWRCDEIILRHRGLLPSKEKGLL